jgi:hypothetical protein
LFEKGEPVVGMCVFQAAVFGSLFRAGIFGNNRCLSTVTGRVGSNPECGVSSRDIYSERE